MAKAVQNPLAAIPNNQPLQEALKPGCAGDADTYHAATKTARYLRAHGKLVVCFGLSEVSEQEALALREELAKGKGRRFASAEFQAAVSSVLRVRVRRVN